MALSASQHVANNEETHICPCCQVTYRGSWIEDVDYVIEDDDKEICIICAIGLYFGFNVT